MPKACVTTVAGRDIFAHTIPNVNIAQTYRRVGVNGGDFGLTLIRGYNWVSRRRNRALLLFKNT